MAAAAGAAAPAACSLWLKLSPSALTEPAAAARASPLEGVTILTGVAAGVAAGQHSSSIGSLEAAKPLQQRRVEQGGRAGGRRYR